MNREDISFMPLVCFFLTFKEVLKHIFFFKRYVLLLSCFRDPGFTQNTVRPSERIKSQNGKEWKFSNLQTLGVVLFFF